MLFPKAFAGIFTPDAELLTFTAKALRIYCGALFIFGIQIACQMTFVSIGNAPCSIIVAILRKFVLLIPLIFIPAAHPAGSDDGCLYRRASRRYAGRDLHDGDVRHAV